MNGQALIVCGCPLWPFFVYSMTIKKAIILSNEITNIKQGCVICNSLPCCDVSSDHRQTPTPSHLHLQLTFKINEYRYADDCCACDYTLGNNLFWRYEDFWIQVWFYHKVLNISSRFAVTPCVISTIAKLRYRFWKEPNRTTRIPTVAKWEIWFRENHGDFTQTETIPISTMQSLKSYVLNVNKTNKQIVGTSPEIPLWIFDRISIRNMLTHQS